MRASHADRDRVISLLEAAFAAGQLTKHDLDRAVDQALAARTHADLAAAATGLHAQPSKPQPPKPFPRPGQTAAWGVCGLVLTAFLTMVIIPSGTTMGVVVLTAAVIYGIFWLLAGTMTLASRRGWLSSARSR